MISPESLDVFPESPDAPYIAGVEVTQAIQYWHADEHLLTPADRGPDNSIPLLADKATYVRVYLNRSYGGPLSGVIGTVTLQRLRWGLWVDTDTLMPQPPGASIIVQTRQTYSQMRGSGGSLNFIIPASRMRGTMRLKVQVEVPGTQFRPEADLLIDASLLQTLRVIGIPVGRDGNFPTLADFHSTAATALRMFPVSQTADMRLKAPHTVSEPINTASRWKSLLAIIRDIQLHDENPSDTIYFALIPNNWSSFYEGLSITCKGFGASVVDEEAMAHELGHALCLDHPPCATGIPQPDPNYPAYLPYNLGSIGEYGVDMAGPGVVGPGAYDIMGYPYCGASHWISPYHYLKLILHPRLAPQWVPVDRESLPPYEREPVRNPIPHHIPDPPPPWVGQGLRLFGQSDPVPLIVLTGWLRDDRIEIRTVQRLRTRSTTVGNEIPGVTVQLLNEQGQVIERAPLLHIAMRASGGFGDRDSENEPTSELIEAYLPDHQRVNALRVMREDQELWSRHATTQPPRISDVSVELDGENLRIRWQAFTSREYPTQRVVRWSSDDGQTWQALAVALVEDEALIPISVLTSGVALIQVRVSDGFYTVEAEPVSISIPLRSPHIAIYEPSKGSVVKNGTCVRLWGAGQASDGRILSSDALRWELDGHPAGMGCEVWAHVPEGEGAHRATLRVLDGNQASELAVTFFAK